MNARAICNLRMMALAGSLLISGCTAYAPNQGYVGLSRDETIRSLGKPNPLPADLQSAQRLDFPRGPFGKHTYSVYFDEQGRAIGFRQLLTEENFEKVIPGMAVTEVITLIGVSKDTFLLGRDRGYVWSYRYDTPLCRWFQIEFSLENKVRSAGYSKPPECRVGVSGFR